MGCFGSKESKMFARPLIETDELAELLGKEPNLRILDATIRKPQIGIEDPLEHFK